MAEFLIQEALRVALRASERPDPAAAAIAAAKAEGERQRRLAESEA